MAALRPFASERQFTTMSTELHATIEALELYSLGRLAEPEVSRLEEHLLICEQCQHRLEEEERFAVTVRSALASEAKRQAEPRRVALPFLNWRWRGLTLAGAATATALILMTFTAGTPGPPQELQLIAQRGPETTMPRARAGAPLRLRMDATEIGALAGYRIEVVSAAGERVWQQNVVASGSSLIAVINRELAAGQYWVRVYGSNEGADALREFGVKLE